MFLKYKCGFRLRHTSEIKMSRVQKFREIRHFRLKLILIIFVFVLTLFAGIVAVDYSMSSLLRGEERIHIFSIRPYGEEYCKISFFDNSLYINTKYISRDYKRVVDWLDSKRKILYR